MSENFFLDNPDLQFRLEQLDLREALELKEKGYSDADVYPGAPRNYADAKDNYRIVLEVLGEICGERVAPRAAEADEEGAHFENGEVTYSAPTLDAIEALRQAELFGAMLPREYGGLNLPESIYSMLVEVVARAESGLMTVYGLQEIASMIEEYADPETKARVLPRFSRGEVSGAMVLTEADAGSDLGAVATRATLDEATGQWHLNGVKRFITNGLADVSVVLARSEEGSTDARGLSMFLVERDETVKIRRIENKMGIHASPTCEIQYNNTPAILIGKRRFGLMRYAMNLMNGARLAVAAQALGIAEAAYREADDYSRERIQFGKPIRVLPAVGRLLLVDEGGPGGDARAAGRDGPLGGPLEGLREGHRRGRRGGPGPSGPPQAVPDPGRDADPDGEVLLHRDGQPGLLPVDAGPRRRRLHAGVQHRAALPRRSHHEHLRRHEPAAGGRGHRQAAQPLARSAADELAAADYPADMAAEKAILVELTAIFRKAVDSLKAQPERDKVDYYACDLVDMAVWLTCGWLLLRDTNVLESKKPVARTYVASIAPRVRAAAEVVVAATPIPLEAIPLLLG